MTDASFTDHGTADGIVTFPTPFDGIRGPNDAEAYYTPLSSGGDYIALCENTHAGGDLIGHAALLRKSDYTEVSPNVPIGSMGWNTGVGIAVAGHASGTSGVSGTGRIFYHRGAHTQALDARIVNTPYDLTSIEGLADPAGGDVRADYRRAFRDPNTGVLWVYFRGNDGKGELYTYNESTEVLDRVGSPFLDFGASTGHYGIKMAFASDGTIYCSVEVLLTATSGFPCHVIGAVKSADAGVTWTNLEGDTITLPIDQSDVTLIAGGTTGDAVIMGQVAVGADGDPVFAFGWERPGDDDFLATYVAFYDSSTETFDYIRLYPEIGPGTDILAEWQNNKIIPHMLSNPDGSILIVMKEVGTGVTQRLVALAHYHDEANTAWHRWVLDTSDLYTGAYVDYNAIADDQKLRVYPVTSGDLDPYDQASEIWEFAVDGFDVWGDLTTFDSIATNSHTDDPVEAGVTYRYRVRALDGTSGLYSAWSDWLTVEASAEVLPGDASVALTADSPAVTQAHSLTPDDATVALSTDSPSLTQGHSLTPDDATVAVVADSPALTQDHALTPGDATVSTTADSPAVTQDHQLQPDSAAIALTVDEPTLTTAGTLVADSATVSLTADSPDVTQDHQLQPDDAAVSLTADAPAVGTGAILTPDGALISVTAAAPTLTQAGALAPDDATISVSADSPAITGPDTGRDITLTAQLLPSRWQAEVVP